MRLQGQALQVKSFATHSCQAEDKQTMVGGGTPATTTQTTQAKKDTGARGFLDTTTTALNLIGKTAFDVSGLGLAVKAAKTFGPKVRESINTTNN
jgi:hypothetical protein